MKRDKFTPTGSSSKEEQSAFTTFQSRLFLFQRKQSLPPMLIDVNSDIYIMVIVFFSSSQLLSDSSSAVSHGWWSLSPQQLFWHVIFKEKTTSPPIQRITHVLVLWFWLASKQLLVKSCSIYIRSSWKPSYGNPPLLDTHDIPIKHSTLYGIKHSTLYGISHIIPGYFHIVYHHMFKLCFPHAHDISNICPTFFQHMLNIGCS